MNKFEIIISILFYVSNIYLRSFRKLFFHGNSLKLTSINNKFIPKIEILAYSLGYLDMLHIHNTRDKLYNFFLHLPLLNVIKHLIILNRNWSLFTIAYKD